MPLDSRRAVCLRPRSRSCGFERMWLGLSKREREEEIKKEGRKEERRKERKREIRGLILVPFPSNLEQGIIVFAVARSTENHAARPIGCWVWRVLQHTNTLTRTGEETSKRGEPPRVHAVFHSNWIAREHALLGRKEDSGSGPVEEEEEEFT